MVDEKNQATQQTEGENKEEVHKNATADKKDSAKVDEKTTESNKEDSQKDNNVNIQEQISKLTEKVESMETIIENTNTGFQETLDNLQNSISNLTLSSGASISEKNVDSQATTPSGEPYVPLDEMDYSLDNK